MSTGEEMIASPITYMVDRKQYAAIAYNFHVFDFVLYQPEKPAK